MGRGETATRARGVWVQAVGLMVAGAFLASMVFLSDSRGQSAYALVGAVILLGGGLLKLSQALGQSSSSHRG
ncbi:hypothetical protein AAII07_08140 [Microvirga sp. 0TCS3.31]